VCVCVSLLFLGKGEEGFFLLLWKVYGKPRVV
jgi:hypothetical protein